MFGVYEHEAQVHTYPCDRDDVPSFGLEHHLALFLTIAFFCLHLCLYILCKAHVMEKSKLVGKFLMQVSLLGPSVWPRVFILENGF